MCHHLLCRGAHADMDFRALNTENPTCPGMSAVGICDHLRLIDDCHIINLIDVKHFHRRGNHSAVFLINPLFARQHRTGDTGFPHLFVNLQRQQTQRTQINALVRRAQTLQCLIGFPAVCRSYMQNKMPLHFQRPREFHFRPRRNHINNLGTDSVFRKIFQNAAHWMLADFARALGSQIFQQPARHQLLLLLPQRTDIQPHQLRH